MWNQSGSQTENVLEFSEVHLAVLNVFSLPLNENITRDEVIRKLKNKGVNAKWNLPYSEDFRIAENFLLPERIAQEYFRLQLDDFKLSFKRVCGTISVDVPLVTNVFLTVYPRARLAILLFNMTLNECSVDDLIFLQHCFYGRFKISVFDPSLKRQKNASWREVAEEYVKSISLALGFVVEKPKILMSRCIEIRGVSNFVISNPKELIEKFSAQIYGLLVADEGWRFVTHEVAEERMLNKWGTRNFLSVVSFGDGVVFINLENGELSKKYTASQQVIRKKYGCEVEEYFLLSSEIAGLNHGPLLMLENASVQLFLLEQVLERMTEMKPKKSIKEFLNAREELIDTLAKLSRIKIPEIGILGKNVQEAMMVTKNFEEAKKILEDVERALIIKYNQRVNLRVLVLTLVSLSIGTLALLIQTGLLKRLMEILHI